MRICVTGLTVALMLAGTSWSAPTVLFEDDFDNERPGPDATAVTVLAHWTVYYGHVDVLGTSQDGTVTYQDVLPGNGCYIDLDGSSDDPGFLVSNQSFYLASDTMYTVTFSLAGNNAPGGQASASDGVGFGVVSNMAPLKTWDVNWDASFETVSYDFWGTDQMEQLLFGNDKGWYDVSGARDYAGPKIDNIVLTENTPCVPVPGAAVLSSLGAALVSFLRRRRALSSAW